MFDLIMTIFPGSATPHHGDATAALVTHKYHGNRFKYARIINFDRIFPFHRKLLRFWYVRVINIPIENVIDGSRI